MFSPQTIIGKLNLELEELQEKIKMLPYIYVDEVVSSNNS